MAASIAIENHYLHRRPNMSFAFGLFRGDEVLGICTFGVPPSRHLQKSLCPSNPSKVIELNRLWVCDSMGKNTESWFISRVLKLLPPFIVVSYADTAAGHDGTIYKASNFYYSGLTDSDRKTPRYDYVVDGKHSRDAFRNGNYIRVRRKPKHKFWTTTGDRRQRYNLEKQVAWPKLRYVRHYPFQ